MRVNPLLHQPLQLINTLSVQYDVTSGMLLAAMDDRTSTNDVAMRTVRVVFTSAIGCFSHMLELVGQKFCTPHLTEFSMWWISHSPKACLLWKGLTGRPMPGYSPTRWWSRWELISQVMELFARLFRRPSEKKILAN